MRNLFLFFSSLGLLLLTASSCSKENTVDCNFPETPDAVYYIRYASNGLEGTYSADYTSENNETVRLSNIKGADFERTIGPVSKGFKANFGIRSTLNYTTVAVRIEVRKGNEPFMVKKEAVSTSNGYACSCSVSYTIE
jgi:hypothetical protein